MQKKTKIIFVSLVLVFIISMFCFSNSFGATSRFQENLKGERTSFANLFNLLKNNTINESNSQDKAKVTTPTSATIKPKVTSVPEKKKTPVPKKSRKPNATKVTNINNNTTKSPENSTSPTTTTLPQPKDSESNSSTVTETKDNSKVLAISSNEKSTSLKTSNGQSINLFESLEGWNISKNGSMTLDNENPMDGSYSLKITGTGSEISLENKISEPIDLSKINNLQMGINVDDPAAIQAISVAFYSDSLYQSSYFINYTGEYELMKGWNKIIRVPTDFSYYDNPDLKKVTGIKITIETKNNLSPVVKFDNFRYDIAGKTKVLFTFDDAWTSIYDNAYKIMEEKNYQGTLWAVKDLTYCGTGEFLTEDQLNFFYSEGWDIGNHSNDHNDNIAGLPYGEKKTNYLSAQDWLYNKGWTRAYKHVCYPSGSHNDELIEVLKSIGVLSARTTIYGIQSVPVEDIYRLKTVAIGRDTPLSQIKSDIDRAIASGSSIMFMLHRVVEKPTETYDASIDDFQEIVNYVSQKDSQNLLDVDTISQWYNEYQ